MMLVDYQNVDICQNGEILKQLQNILNNIHMNCSDEINCEYSTIRTNIIKNGVGYEIFPNIIRINNKEISYKKQKTDFISEGATELVNYVKPLYVNEVVLFRLMNEGIIMPTGLKYENQNIFIDLKFPNENIPIKIEIDQLPFKKFIVVKLP